MKYTGRISGKQKEAVLLNTPTSPVFYVTKEVKGPVFYVTGECGRGLYLTPEQMITVVDWEKLVETSSEEEEILLRAVK